MAMWDVFVNICDFIAAGPGYLQLLALILAADGIRVLKVSVGLGINLK